MRINTQKGIAPLAALIIALLVIGGGGYAVKKGVDKQKEKKTKEEQVMMEKKEKVEKEENEKRAEATRGSALHIKIDEQNGSGQKGEATITQTGTSTVKVIVSMTGKPSGVPQPAHIHLGSCPSPGAVKYPLMSVDKGASQTEIPNITLEQLLSELPLAINVHKSAANVKIYTSCGDIVKEQTRAIPASSGVAGTEKKENKSTTEKDAVQKETKVNYTAAGFAPKTVTIKKGDTVVFENKTGKVASVASDVHPTHLLYPEFDQYKTAERGKDEFRFSFEKVGTWNYHDHLNPIMTGTVTVTE